jgi:predicted TPR repeat methyltransferase
MMPTIHEPAHETEQSETDLAVARWAEVDQKFRALLDAGIPTARALDRRGRQLLQENRLPEAMQSFRLATMVEPNNPVCWMNYGVLLERTNALTDAIEALEHSLALSARQPDTWLVLGLTRAKLGAVEAAEAAYHRVLELDPNSAIAWQCLGLLKEGIRRYDEAIDCFQTCLARGGASAALWANLGKLLQQTGRVSDSALAYAEAVRLDGSNAKFRDMLRRSQFRRDVVEGRPIEQALAGYLEFAPEPPPTDRELQDLLSTTFTYLAGFGQREAAVRLGRKYLWMWPDSPSIEYLLKAIEGKETLDRSPAAYITEHFDAFAEGFDAQLVGVLGYDIPEKLAAAVLAVAPPGHRYDALDVGCGTGLCGARLLPCVRTLAGVDLSPKMLKQAAKRGIYGELACGDLLDYLHRAPGRFDLVVAADVMIYLGDLAPFFAAAARALPSGGLLALSIEVNPHAAYQLAPSGRFAHSVPYVRSLADPAFEEQACLATTIRWETATRVPGQIFVFRRR